jgi:hypothetical protein
MNTSRKLVEAIARVGLILAVVLAAASAGCGDDGGTVAPNPDGGDAGSRDAAEDLPPPPGGSIPPPPDGAEAPSITIDANYTPEMECCTVELSIADTDGNETTARLVGDQAPLNAEGGVALTHSDGRWRASVCLPVHTWVKYRFHFGSKMIAPEIPPTPDAGADADQPDAGADADESDAIISGTVRGRIANGVDAGAGGEEEDGGDIKPEAGEAVDAEPPPVYAPDASEDAPQPDAPLVTVDDFRYAPELPQVTDGDGTYNLFSPVNSCTAP